MKLKDLMSRNVITVEPEETVAVAARILARNNIGILPVKGRDGKLLGVVTDRDLVTRCVAAGRRPEDTKVREIMTAGVVAGGPEMEVWAAAHMMGRSQIRRLPVVEDGKLRGMVSLGDLACREETAYDAADALTEISSNVSVRE